MDDRAFMLWMRLLPKAALSSLVGKATRARAPAKLRHAAMRAFAKRYRVDLDEAEHPIEGYPTFGDFFARALKPGLRPIAEGEKVVVSPVDGAVSQVGTIEKGSCVQAKGINFSVEKLLGDGAEAERYLHGGSFVTLYLSPRDYHRIHTPLAGRILGFRYLPGEFWPVNQASVRSKEALFCLNERLVTYLETAAGKCAVVKVGATCVSRIRASYDSVVTHDNGAARAHTYPLPRPIGKGDELGRFEMGSTVILLFEPGRVRWDGWLAPESVVRMGQKIGEVL
jgi:phosphatidylserine decarboxylase